MTVITSTLLKYDEEILKAEARGEQREREAVVRWLQDKVGAWILESIARGEPRGGE